MERLSVCINRHFAIEAHLLPRQLQMLQVDVGISRARLGAVVDPKGRTSDQGKQQQRGTHGALVVPFVDTRVDGLISDVLR